MRRRDAREIRRGIRVANEYLDGKRMRPKLTPFGFSGAPTMPLWERAYHHVLDRAVRSGRLRLPGGPSGIGSER